MEFIESKKIRSYCRLKLNKHKWCLVDIDDLPRLVKHRWSADLKKGVWYVRTKIVHNKKFKNIEMHRIVMNLKHGDGKVVDHINHNGLDNRKSNLRLCTKQQNCSNMKLFPRGKNKHRGITWHSTNRRWIVRITVNRKTFQIGSFINRQEGLEAYKQKSVELLGEFSPYWTSLKEKYGKS